MIGPERLKELARNKESVIADMNHCIWDYAEFGYSEFKSAAKITEVLENEGFSVEKGTAGIPTAFIGTFGEGRPYIGILAEYDSLPELSQELGVAEKRPIPGKDYGHGCGHSALGAGAVGAALVLKDYLKDTGVKGTVKLIGCPAEETGFGKAFLAKAHVFDDLDMVFTWHPADMNGCMAIKAVGYYKVKYMFKGITAHAGGAPELGRSALDACEIMNVGVNYLREHIISNARVHYAYLDVGGQAPNVVQDHAALLYFVRAPKLSQSAEIMERINNCARGAALMTGTEVTIKVLGGLSDLIPNRTAAEVLSDAYVAAGGPEFGEEEYEIARRFLDILPADKKQQVIANGAKANGISEEEFAKRPLNTAVKPFDPAMMNIIMTGSTDVGDVSYIVPTAQLVAATAIPGTGTHTWQMTAQVGTGIGDKACVAVAAAIGLACARVYDDPSICEKAKEELLATTGGQYTSPIPDDITYDQAI